MRRKPRTPHDAAVEDLLWCFSQGMTRDQAFVRMGYKTKSGIEQIITRERRYAKISGRKSRL